MVFTSIEVFHSIEVYAALFRVVSRAGLFGPSLGFYFRIRPGSGLNYSARLQLWLCYQRWSRRGRPRGHILKFLVLKPISHRKCPFHCLRTALVFDSLKRKLAKQKFTEFVNSIAVSWATTFFCFFFDRLKPRGKFAIIKLTKCNISDHCALKNNANLPTIF